MRIKLLFLSVLFSLLSLLFFRISVFADVETIVIVLPGAFYFTIHGDMQDGISLAGLRPAGTHTSQVGYWNADTNLDYLKLYDSTGIEGYRLQLYMGSNFEYVGPSTSQSAISATKFITYSNWDSINKIGEMPTIGSNSNYFTYFVDSSKSCKPSDTNPYSDYYQFNSSFVIGDFKMSLSTNPKTYFESKNSCRNEGTLVFGRFQLDLGVVKAGEYKSSLYIIMMDGF